MKMNNKLTRQDQAARLAITLSVSFLTILTLLHFLKPEFDPSWRMISEYEIGRFGWLMRVNFPIWGLSLLTFAVAFWQKVNGFGGKFGLGWFAVMVIFLFGAGIFVTNPILDESISTANTVHAICGAFVIMTFPIASLFVVSSLTRSKKWTAPRWHLWLFEALVWLSMVGFFASISISNAINPGAGRVGPEVYIGWPNRIMVLIYHLWIIILASDLRTSTQQA